MSVGQPPVFKPDTAYMEVPRCDRCRFWGNVAEAGLDMADGSSWTQRQGECAAFSTRPGVVTDVQPLRDAVAVGLFLTLDRFGCVQFEERVSATP